MLNNQVFLLFLIIALGYTIGRLKIKSLNLGSAGILIIALIFGHFGYEIPPIIQSMGLVCFVTSVGFVAGPTFFKNFKGKASSYVIIGGCIISSSVLVCLFVIKICGVSTDLSLGLLAGALTTTPGLAAGVEATGSDLVSVGYGLAYPFGVVSVVLFVQIVPGLLHINIDAEKNELKKKTDISSKQIPDNMIRFDSYGLFSFSIAIIVGLLIGRVMIPLPGKGTFSLGTSGGPLLAGILLGHFQTICIFDLRVKNGTLVAMRELGLALFLAGSGTQAGKGFVRVLLERGPVLFLYGALMSVVPLLVGYLVANKGFKLGVLDSLGSICGGMTSTPALGSLIHSTGTDDVTSSYAATYPVALALIVIFVKIIGGSMG